MKALPLRATVLFIPLFSSLCACGTGSAQEDEAVRTAEPDLGIYEEARRFLRDPGAQVWSEDIPLDALIDLVNDCYHAGAEEVVFAGIDEFNGMRVSAWLAVRLPEAGTERVALLRAFEAFVTRYDASYAARDEGQRSVEPALD